MRLWSLHPSYLDSVGLTACWREGLLARAVLQGRTLGYRNHPQLERFRAQPEPLVMLDTYLRAILEEAHRRGFAFDASKIGPRFSSRYMTVTTGQLMYEWQHLKEKLKRRAFTQYEKIASLTEPLPHPLFQVVVGEIEPWERLPGRTLTGHPGGGKPRVPSALCE